jgi:nucleoside-diphosphate-sugar epimerase
MIGFGQKELMDPTVKGTKNVLEACSAINVQKLVVVSSVAASLFDPNWPEGELKDESCWMDKQLYKYTQVSNAY